MLNGRGLCGFRYRLPAGFVLLGKVGAKLNVFGYDKNTGMGLPTCINPAALFKPSNNPDATAFASLGMAVLCQLSPRFNVEEAHFFLHPIIAVVKAV